MQTPVYRQRKSVSYGQGTVPMHVLIHYNYYNKLLLMCNL